ncbi:hypothetical protein CORC01_10424 [Colletotrichum orchidophilum]|uniref:Uncharacterized protein n=1 Tax=Colletotrichum orchidophilum TaxID=1209926 RepID=A0A1G4AYP0_9PEZI|nr:uncharacterized protein CORC01_10424 [Colletotrichum orchidophilum]OHE94264.1 hypothetical protein CORC01_10424 [Colletotrichum orchidophilum]
MRGRCQMTPDSRVANTPSEAGFVVPVSSWNSRNHLSLSPSFPSAPPCLSADYFCWFDQGEFKDLVWTCSAKRDELLSMASHLLAAGSRSAGVNSTEKVPETQGTRRWALGVAVPGLLNSAVPRRMTMKWNHN